MKQNAEKYFRRAIEIDPDYLEAHASFGGMLLDTGNTDEAIRQFETVIRREPNNVLALTNLAQAYRMKDLYSDSIESARKAVKSGPGVGRAASLDGRQPAPERPVRGLHAGVRQLSAAE